jgi:hypothetical protein
MCHPRPDPAAKFEFTLAARTSFVETRQRTPTTFTDLAQQLGGRVRPKATNQRARYVFVNGLRYCID